MSDKIDPQSSGASPGETPGAKTPEAKTGGWPLWKQFSVVGAVVAAVGALVVLPTEFGRDPTGFGAATGLDALAPDRGGVVASDGAPAHFFPTAYKTETLRIELGEFEEVEHKFLMDEGASMVYSWRVESDQPIRHGGVYYDFHGHPDEANAADYPEGFFQSYREEQEAVAGNGSLVAPFPGHQGWFFLNLEEGPVTVVVEVSGFYKGHEELYRYAP